VLAYHDQSVADITRRAIAASTKAAASPAQLASYDPPATGVLNDVSQLRSAAPPHR